MKSRHHTCDSASIVPFLEGRLPAAAQTRLEVHLAACPACRDRLEATAASRDFWNETSLFLRPDALDAESTGWASGVAALSHLPTADAVRQPDPLGWERFLDPTDDPHMLGRFGGYEIVGVVGSGGMGLVFKGYETALDRYVAIKVLAPHLSSSGAARKRFAREARAAAAVLHENVVAIHRVDEANGLPFLVMPYLAGESLQKRLDERGPLQLVEVLRIARQVAAGLAAAHAQGLVHRDVKPANVLLDRGIERVVLTDFGLARAADDASLTRSGVIAGTPQYMSPEQARGEPVDGRSDLFSLGSLMYAMSAGRPPFRAETPYGVLRRIVDAQPHPLRDLVPELPPWFCNLVARLHAPQPRDRFASAAEVADLLERCLAHLQRPADVPLPAPLRFRLLRRFGRLPWAAAGGAIAVMLAALCIAVFQPVASGPGASAPPAGQAAATAGQDTVDVQRTPRTQPPAATPFEPLTDEATLLRDHAQVRQDAARLEHGWTAHNDLPDRWNETVADLHRQLDDLTRRLAREIGR